MHIQCAFAYVYRYQPFTMRRDFEGSVYCDEIAEICGTFRGRLDFKVWRDFDEIWYIIMTTFAENWKLFSIIR